ncbi:MAG: septal ring lytic transglycosylase RlpA family protein [Hyphomicrobium sp.]
MLNKLGPRFARALFSSLRSCAAPMAGVAGILGLTVPDVIAKTPGSTYCFYGTCHRVKTLAETESLVGKAHSLTASFYDSCKVDRYNPCGLTSSGEQFHPDRADNAASPIYPDGTLLLVWSPETKEAAILRVNNAGPYWGKRNLDVSRAAAEQLGFRHKGVGRLEARVLSAPDRGEATYKRNRRYEPVPGAIGQFESIDAAMDDAAAFLEVRTVAALMESPFALVERKQSPKSQGVPVLVAAKQKKPETTVVAAADAPATTASTPARTRVASVEAPSRSVAERKAKRSFAGERRIRKPESRVAARTTVRKSSAVRVASVRRAPTRMAMSERAAAPRHHGPLITLDYGSHAHSVASGRVARLSPTSRSGRVTGPPSRSASVSRGRSMKRLSAAPGRLRVSDARDAIAPARGPVTGQQSRPPASLILNDAAPRLRGVPARQLLAVV